MTDDESEANKTLVLEALIPSSTGAIIPQRSISGRRIIFSSAHIAPGREGLSDLIRAAPRELQYEHGLILAEGDHVMVHGRFSGTGRPAAWIGVDILRIENGLLAEHWDVLQDEATADSSVSGLPMFGAAFP